MSKSHRKTRAQKIKAQQRRLPPVANETSMLSSLPAMNDLTSVPNPSPATPNLHTNKNIESLYAYPVNLIKADMFKSLIISGILMAGLGVIAWLRK